jgi:hypothetical protein
VELVQARLVTEDVAGLAAFYAALVGAKVPLNEYYVEVPAGRASVGFSKRRFTEYCPDRLARPDRLRAPGEVILDFMVRDADAGIPADRGARGRLGAAAGHAAVGKPVHDFHRPRRQPRQRVLPALTPGSPRSRRVAAAASPALAWRYFPGGGFYGKRPVSHPAQRYSPRSNHFSAGQARLSQAGRAAGLIHLSSNRW